ncbi:MAG: hypothetical protein M1490_04240 [Candidatus Bathyarchaeota archaeon]|nr:hypothetical protein [Candidatus Bathyarchaeota archaeon]
MEDDSDRLGHLKPEQKVLIAIDMTDGCARVCAEGIRQQFPEISDAELLEKLRERLEWAKQNR